MSDRVTIDGLLRDANAYAAACEMTGNRGAKVYEICRGIVELLGTPIPCELPLSVDHDAPSHCRVKFGVYKLTADETIALGAALIRAGSEAKAADAKRGGEAG